MMTHDADPNDQALLAAVSGDTTTLENLILDHSVNVNAKDKHGFTLLHLAAHKGHLDTMQLLLDLGATIDEQSNNNQETPLHVATYAGHANCVQELVDRGAELDLYTRRQTTALQIAVNNYQDEITKILVTAGADYTIPDDGGFNAITDAVLANNQYALDLMVEQGADLTVPDDNHKKPLELAIDFAIDSMIDYLVKATGEDPQDYLLQQQLATVFNHVDVNEFLNKDSDELGGTRVFALNILKPALKQFVTSHKIENLKSLIDMLDESEIDDLVVNPKLDRVKISDRLNQGKSVLLSGGHLDHSMPITIKQLDQSHYRLTMVDRGEFAELKPGHPYKCYPIRTIDVPQEKINDVIDLVLLAKRCHVDQSKEILFADIPKLTGTSLVVDPLEQSVFKRGQCFFENYKSLLLHEFRQIFLNNKALLLYKDFDISLHQQSLKAFQDYAAHHPSSIPQNARQILFAICKDIIVVKQAELLFLAIKHNKIEIVEQLLREDKTLLLKTSKHEKLNAYYYAAKHKPGMLKILNPLYHQLAYEEALAIDFLNTKQLEALKQTNPILHAAYCCKQLIAEGKLKEAKQMDPWVYEAVVINDVLSEKANAAKYKLSLSDPSLFASISSNHLIQLATYYQHGHHVPQDFLTAEALLQRAQKQLNQFETLSTDDDAKFKSEEIAQLIVNLKTHKTIAPSNHQLKDNKQEKKYMEFWQNDLEPKAALLKFLSAATTWSPRNWISSQTGEIKKFVTSLTTNSTLQNKDEIRSELLEKRLDLLQTGTKPDAQIIQMLNFAAERLEGLITPAPQPSLQQSGEAGIKR